MFIQMLLCILSDNLNEFKQSNDFIFTLNWKYCRSANSTNITTLIHESYHYCSTPPPLRVFLCVCVESWSPTAHWSQTLRHRWASLGRKLRSELLYSAMHASGFCGWLSRLSWWYFCARSGLLAVHGLHNPSAAAASHTPAPQRPPRKVSQCLEWSRETACICVS